MFVPALNGAHGHGFLSAGLTGFALQGHEAGVKQGQSYSVDTSKTPGEFAPDSLRVAVLSRPIRGALGSRGYRHNALFIYAENEDGTRQILRQYSIAKPGTRFLDEFGEGQFDGTFIADREHFVNPTGDELYYEIVYPEGMTVDEFARAVFEEAEVYIADRYRPRKGPNSNTGALAPVIRAGGRIRNEIPGAEAQCYELQCLPETRLVP